MTVQVPDEVFGVKEYECTVVSNKNVATRTAQEAQGLRKRGASARDDIEQVSLDLVPAGWAQRVARALAPLRDVSAQGDAGAIPRSSRLLDVIGMPEPDAAAVFSSSSAKDLAWTTFF